jgi:DNA-binding CsgD family transcriptional regulator
MRIEGAEIQRLTERQKDCLRLVAQGYTSKEIGRVLDLSPSTVDNHILAAVQATGAASRGEASRILAAQENRQKLPRELQALAEPRNLGLLSSSVDAPVLSISPGSNWSLPPVGGQTNDLDASERTIRIMQVAAVGFGTVMGLMLLIAGVFKLFS